MEKRSAFRLLLVAIALAAPPPSFAQQRRAPDPPVRQPTLIYRIPDADVARPAARPVEPPALARRPAAPLADQQKFYDPGLAASPLQQAHEALAGFPVDRGGFVDWIAAASAGLVGPRSSLDGRVAPPADVADVVLRNTKEMPPVRFPHATHADLLGCASCHPAPFPEKAGATAITMERIFRGEACGMCHGKVAFPAWVNCERCHSVKAVGATHLYGPAPERDAGPARGR